MWHTSRTVMGRSGNRIRTWGNQTKRKKNQEISCNVKMRTGHLYPQNYGNTGVSLGTVFSKAFLSWTSWERRWKDRHRSAQYWNINPTARTLLLAEKRWVCSRGVERGTQKGMEGKASRCQSHKVSPWQRSLPSEVTSSCLTGASTYVPKSCAWWENHPCS